MLQTTTRPAIINKLLSKSLMADSIPRVDQVSIHSFLVKPQPSTNISTATPQLKAELSKGNGLVPLRLSSQRLQSTSHNEARGRRKISSLHPQTSGPENKHLPILNFGGWSRFRARLRILLGTVSITPSFQTPAQTKPSLSLR